MSSTYFNFMLEEIRSAESSENWGGVACLFFNSHFYDPPEEEMQVIRHRLRTSKEFTHRLRWTGYISEGLLRKHVEWTQARTLTSHLVNHYLNDIFYEGRRTDDTFYLAEDPWVIQFILTDDVWEYLRDFGTPPSRPKKNEEEPSSHLMTRGYLAYRHEIIANMQLFLMAAYQDEKPLHEQISLRGVPELSYKECKQIHKHFVDFCTSRALDQKESMEALREIVRVDFMDEVTPGTLRFIQASVGAYIRRAETRA